jgi:hypothetical protein
MKDLQTKRGKTISFFNELDTEKLCSKTSVSFFNEVASDMKKLSSKSLLIMDSKRKMLWNDTMSRDKTRSWLPRGLHLKEETHSRRTPCRGSRQELRDTALTTLSKILPWKLLDLRHKKLNPWATMPHN